MPFINTKTNISLSKETKVKIKKEFGKLISLFPGKSEDWLMVGFDDKEGNLFFQGSDAPCAMVEVKVYGSLPSSSLLNDFTSKATAILTKTTAIPSDRIYIKYEGIENWGWSGSNF